MNQEIMLVIPLVRHFELPERDIANRRVKEAVRQFCVLKALHGNTVFLIKLLCNSSRNCVKLNTVEFSVLHTVRDKSHKVADTAGRLQHIAAFEIHIFKSLVYCLDNNGRRIKCG